MGVAADGDERTYSIWGFVVAFVVLGAIGLFAVLAIGNTRSGTVQLPTRQTTSTTSVPETTPTTPPVTVPGGAPAPEGVQEVIVDGGVTSYAFATPAELAQIPVRAVVPPATVTPSADGRELVVGVSCAVAVGESLAQITVTTDPATVTVLPVTLAPANAPPCDPTAAPRQVTLPLGEPLGARPVIVVPGGTEVPTPTPG
jgi:hypothetical protein